MILTILILLGIGLALYSCVTHGLCFLVGVLLAVGYTLALILVFLLLVALLLQSVWGTLFYWATDATFARTVPLRSDR